MSTPSNQQNTVIILGASPHRRRFSNKALRCYRDLGYRVFPIHPAAESIEGEKVYPDLASLPEKVAVLLVYVRPEIALQKIDDAVEAGVREVVLNPGTVSPELVTRCEELGLVVREECAIVAVGHSPSEYPD